MLLLLLLLHVVCMATRRGGAGERDLRSRNTHYLLSGRACCGICKWWEGGPMQLTE